MSENEFDLYLSLLGRFLRLKPQQRDQIADELRDQLDARLEDLRATGLSREEAIRRALDEFGDAASLAEHFSQLSLVRRRRFVMRCTLGTIGATAAAIFLATAFWPMEPGAAGPGRLVADDSPQQKLEFTGLLHLTNEAQTLAQTRRAKVEQALDSTTLTPHFQEAPFTDALQFLAATLKMDIVVSTTFAPQDNPITLNLQNPISARTVLELVLEKESSGAGYVIRDGFIYITQKAQTCELAVYNCRDLIAEMANQRPAQPTPSVPEAKADDGKKSPQAGQQTAAEKLIDVIQSLLEPTEWNEVDGPTIKEIKGLLLVNHTQAGQRKIQNLLEMLRAQK